MQKLESSDGHIFTVSREIAEMSETVRNMLGDVEGDADATIPLPNVTGEILAKVLLTKPLSRGLTSNPFPPLRL